MCYEVRKIVKGVIFAGRLERSREERTKGRVRDLVGVAVLSFFFVGYIQNRIFIFLK